MRYILTIFFCCILFQALYSNDGAYYSSGGVFYPTVDTDIKLCKEVLSFNINENYASVNVLFEFENPTEKEITLLVGFQSPSSAGDISDNDIQNKQIQNFTVIKNGMNVPFQTMVAECEDCELQEKGSLEFSAMNPGVFVYLFEISFQPGINKIQHTYGFYASSSVTHSQLYNYVLTTGAKWANQQIDDFTLTIEFSEKIEFFVSDSFPAAARWQINGEGKIKDQPDSEIFGSLKKVFVQEGTLNIFVGNYQPNKNLSFGTLNMPLLSN